MISLGSFHPAPYTASAAEESHSITEKTCFSLGFIPYLDAEKKGAEKKVLRLTSHHGFNSEKHIETELRLS